MKELKETWMNDFTSTFIVPSPSPVFISGVKRNVKLLIREQRKKEEMKAKIVTIVTVITLASIPGFLFLNYMYYLMLQYTLMYVLPFWAAQICIFFSMLILALLGTICYGSIPICTALFIKNLEEKIFILNF